MISTGIVLFIILTTASLAAAIVSLGLGERDKVILYMVLAGICFIILALFCMIPASQT